MSIEKILGESFDEYFNSLIEEFEEINELSKKTLGNYIKKAHTQSIKRVKDATNDLHKDYEYSRDDYWDELEDVNKRSKYIGKAVNKISNNNNKLGKYIKKATKDNLLRTKNSIDDYQHNYGDMNRNADYKDEQDKIANRTKYVNKAVDKLTGNSLRSKISYNEKRYEETRDNKYKQKADELKRQLDRIQK